jgi:hypothetical protein
MAAHSTLETTQKLQMDLKPIFLSIALMADLVGPTEDSAFFSFSLAPHMRTRPQRLNLLCPATCSRPIFVLSFRWNCLCGLCFCTKKVLIFLMSHRLMWPFFAEFGSDCVLEQLTPVANWWVIYESSDYIELFDTATCTLQ